MEALVLNANYQAINIVDWKRAIKLVKKEKVRVLKYRDELVKTSTKSERIPLVVILKYLITEISTRIMPNRASSIRFNVFLRDNFTCAYCGIQYAKKLTVDHIIPKVQGGKTTYENIVTCCEKCNQKKGGRTPEQANMRLLFQPRRSTLREILQYTIKMRLQETCLQASLQECNGWI